MRGFKLFFQILKSNIIVTSAYLFILVLSSFIFGAASNQVQSRAIIDAPIYYVEINDNLINNLPKDETKIFEYLLDNNLLLTTTDDVLSKGLYNHTLNYVRDNEMEPEHVDNANYTGIIHGALILPSNLSKLNQNQVFYIFHTSFKDTSQFTPLDLAISKYMNVYYSLLDVYHENNIVFNNNDLVNQINENLDYEVKVDLSSPIDAKVKLLGTFFNFSTYIISANIVLIIGIIIFEIKKTEIFRRISIAPYDKTKFIFGIIFAAVLMAFGLVAFVFLMSAITNPNTTLTLSGLYFLLNLLLFVIPLTAVSVFLGLVISKQEIVSMLSTVLALAQGFFTGAFVPAEFLSDGLLTLGKIFPASYTIEINRLLVEQSSANLGNILFNGGILLVYFVVFFALSLFVFQKKVKKE